MESASEELQLIRSRWESRSHSHPAGGHPDGPEGCDVCDVEYLWVELEAARSAWYAGWMDSNRFFQKPPPVCPACGSITGELGTAGAYFMCRRCGDSRFWTKDGEREQMDGELVVLESPYGRETDVMDILRRSLVEIGEQLESGATSVAAARTQSARLAAAIERRLHSLGMLTGGGG